MRSIVNRSRPPRSTRRPIRSARFNDPCPQTPVPRAPTSNAQVQIFNPHIPLMHVRNSCDIGGICPNGNTFAPQMRSIGVSLDDVILDPEGKPVTACDDHLRHQPDGRPAMSARAEPCAASCASSAMAVGIECADVRIHEAASARRAGK